MELDDRALPLTRGQLDIWLAQETRHSGGPSITPPSSSRPTTSVARAMLSRTPGKWRCQSNERPCHSMARCSDSAFGRPQYCLGPASSPAARLVAGARDVVCPVIDAAAGLCPPPRSVGRAHEWAVVGLAGCRNHKLVAGGSAGGVPRRCPGHFGGRLRVGDQRIPGHRRAVRSRHQGLRVAGGPIRCSAAPSSSPASATPGSSTCRYYDTKSM